MGIPNPTVTQCVVLIDDPNEFQRQLPGSADPDQIRPPDRVQRLAEKTSQMIAGHAGEPVSLLPCGGRPFLAWPMRELVRYGVTDFVLLTAQVSDQIERAAAAAQASLPRRAGITLLQVPAQGGSVGALLHVRDHLDPRFLLCRGDVLFDGNLADLLADATIDPPEVVARVMLLRHGVASCYGATTVQGDRITSFAENIPGAALRFPSAGVSLFRRTIVDHLASAGSLEADTLPHLAAAGMLRATLSDSTFRDIDSPDDLTAARADIPALLHRKALFLDRDGVLNIDHGYVGTQDRFEWVEGALDAIRYATRAGWHVFVATNQSGVARGFFDEAAASTLLDWIAGEARRNGGTIDDWRYCPFHPEATIDGYRQPHHWRKPLPGMLLDLMAAWEIDPRRSIMVGDQATDMQAAAAAGVAGYLFPGGNLAAFVKPLLDARI